MPTDPQPLTIFLAASTGLGLAAACGLRVFLPVLFLGLAVRAEVVRVTEGFQWLGATPALVAFGVAAGLELTAFLVPFVDNLLDTLATPAAALAGALVTTSVLVDLDPWLQWSLGVIAGAGVATLVQLPTVAARGASSVTTAGTANPGLGAGEAVTASLLSGMAIYAPIAAPMVVLAVVAGAIHLSRRNRARSSD